MFSASNITCGAQTAEQYLRQEHKKIERYYNGPESDVEHGIYVGGKAFQLDGKVIGSEFGNLLDGKNPQGEPLWICKKENKRLAYDLTFSPDKSVSLLWSRLDENERREFENTALKATKDTLKHIQENILNDCVRRGKGGVLREAPQDLTFAVFQHGSSRAGDPQLHHHAILLNTAQRKDGSWGALEAKKVFVHNAEIRRYYDLSLAWHLKKDYGIQVERRDEGIRINGISEELIDRFSKRRNEIYQMGEESGFTSAAARQVHNLQSREAKTSTEKELLPLWQKEFDSLGFRKEHALSILTENKRILQEKESEHTQALECAKKKIFETFGERNLSLTEPVLRKVVAQEFTGIIPPEKFEEQCKNIIHDKRLIELEAAPSGLRRFTTEDILENERKLTLDAVHLSKKVSHEIQSEKADSILTKYIESGMSHEQALATRELLSGGDLVLLYGAAGTGKSYSLKALREISEEQGYQVRGLAPTGKAAEALEKSSDIPSQTLHKFLHDFKKQKDQFNQKDIVVVDEAGMIGSEKAALLIEQVQKSGAKLVLVGDDKQIAPIESGTPFSKFKEEIQTSSILTIRRQSEEWQRVAATQIREGDVNTALCSYEENNCIHHSTTWKKLSSEMVNHYLSERQEGKTQLILVPTNKMKNEINETIQNLRFERKEVLRKNEVHVPVINKKNEEETRRFFTGDRIIFLKNDYKLGVKNGSGGEISKIKRLGRQRFLFHVSLDDKRTISFQTKDYPHIDTGYASTVHKAQGETVDRTYFVATKQTGKEAAYVSLTRHRESIRVYCSTQLIHTAREKFQREEISKFQKKLNLNAMTVAFSKEAPKEENNVELSPLPPVSQKVRESKVYATEQQKNAVLGISNLSREEKTSVLYELCNSPHAVSKPLATYNAEQKVPYKEKAKSILSSGDYSKKQMEELKTLTLQTKTGVMPVLTTPERQSHLEKNEKLKPLFELAQRRDLELSQAQSHQATIENSKGEKLTKEKKQEQKISQGYSMSL